MDRFWLRRGVHRDGVFAGGALHHRVLQPRVGVVGFVMGQHRPQLPGMLVGDGHQHFAESKKKGGKFINPAR